MVKLNKNNNYNLKAEEIFSKAKIKGSKRNLTKKTLGKHAQNQLNTGGTGDQSNFLEVDDLTPNSDQKRLATINKKNLAIVKHLKGRKNHLFQKTVFNQSTWAMDETILGDTQIFIVVNLFSGQILGYVITEKPSTLTSAKVTEVIKLCISNVIDEKGALPPFLHGDKALLYLGKDLCQLLKESGIELSTALGASFGNQKVESINNFLKFQIAFQCFNLFKPKDRAQFAEKLNPKQTKLTIHRRARNSEIRKLLWNSSFFRNMAKMERFQIIENAIEELNNQVYSQNLPEISRKLADFLNNLACKENLNFQGFKKSSMEGQQTLLENYKTIKLLHDQLVAQFVDLNDFFKLSAEKQREIVDKLKNLQIQQVCLSETPSKQKSWENLTVVIDNLNVDEKQKETLRNDPLTRVVLAGFKTTFIQNVELQQNIADVQLQNKELLQKVKDLHEELERDKKIRAEKLDKKIKFQNRRKVENKACMTLDKYTRLLKIVGSKDDLKSLRLRVSFCVLFVTGLRICEVLSLKNSQLETLFLRQRPFIAADRKKRGPTNKKAFLTGEGQAIVKNRRADFEKLMEAGSTFLFPSKNKLDKTLTREHYTKFINFNLKALAAEFNEHITSHAFRSGFITELWQVTEDIEFVRQVIGHASISTTQRYIKPLTEEQQAKRMAQLSQPEKVEKLTADLETIFKQHDINQNINVE